MKFRLFRTAVPLCALVELAAVLPAMASQAYVSVCCTVPSAISVIDRATHILDRTLLAGEGAAFRYSAPVAVLGELLTATVSQDGRARPQSRENHPATCPPTQPIWYA